MRQQYYLSGNSKANFNYLLPLPFFLGSSSTRRTPTPTPCPPPEPPGCPAPTRVPAPTSAPLRPLVVPRKRRTTTRRDGAARAKETPLRSLLSGGSRTCHKKIVFSCCYCCYRNLPDLGNACRTWLLSVLADATAILPSPSSHRSCPDPPRMSPASFQARRIQAPRADRGLGGSFLSSSSTTAMVTGAWKWKKISHFNLPVYCALQ